MYLLTVFAYKPVSERVLNKIANSSDSKKITIINKVNREKYNRDDKGNATSIKRRPKRETIPTITSQKAVKQAASSGLDVSGLGVEPKYKYSDTLDDIRDSINYTTKGQKYYQGKGEIDKAKEFGDNLKEHQKMLKQWSGKQSTNTTTKLGNAVKPKTKLLTGKKLAVGVIATGLGLAAINKLRKSRNDKNKKRGKYRKFK